MAARSAQSSYVSTLASGSRVIVVVSKGPSPEPPAAFVNVPDVVGKRQGDALSLLQDMGSSAQVFNDYSATAKRGVVMGQLPPASMGVPTGTDGILLVSSGPTATETAEVVLPDVVGKSEDDAVSTLQASGFAPQVIREFSPTTPAGTVMAQLPSRDSLAEPAGGTSPWVWVAVAAAVIAAVALLAFFFFQPAKTVAVPNVVGMTQTEAVTALSAVGLEASATAVPGTKPGSVTTQTPAGGADAKKGSVVVIGVVQPVATVAIPDVVGQKQADATAALKSAGFSATSVVKDSADVAAGLVIEQTPGAGTEAPKGASVTLVVSGGQSNVKVPDVTGLSSADAQKALSEAGLKVVLAESPSDTVPADSVITQLPAAGDSVAPGTSVGLVVSTGPPTAEQVSVPNVVGMSLADAKTTLTAAGLESVPVPSTDSAKPADEVIAQSPVADAKTAPGGQVVLFYSAP